MYGHDYNLLPVDSTGVLVPLPVSETTAVGFVHGSPSTFSGGFADVEWLAYPWMYVMFRYDGVNSNSDYTQRAGTGGIHRLALQRGGKRHPQSVHAGGAIPYPRQHQSGCRIPNQAVAIGRIRSQPDYRLADGYQLIPC